MDLSLFDGQIEFEPMYTLKHDYGFFRKLRRKIKIGLRNVFKLKNPMFLDIESYDYLWKRILNRKRSSNLKTYLGAFVSWDNSPRRKERGFIVREGTFERIPYKTKFDYVVSISALQWFVANKCLLQCGY